MYSSFSPENTRNKSFSDTSFIPGLSATLFFLNYPPFYLSLENSLLNFFLEYPHHFHQNAVENDHRYTSGYWFSFRKDKII